MRLKDKYKITFTGKNTIPELDKLITDKVKIFTQGEIFNIQTPFQKEDGSIGFKESVFNIYDLQKDGIIEIEEIIDNSQSSEELIAVIAEFRQLFTKKNNGPALFVRRDIGKFILQEWEKNKIVEDPEIDSVVYECVLNGCWKAIEKWADLSKGIDD